MRGAAVFAVLCLSLTIVAIKSVAAHNELRVIRRLLNDEVSAGVSGDDDDSADDGEDDSDDEDSADDWESEGDDDDDGKFVRSFEFDSDQDYDPTAFPNADERLRDNLEDADWTHRFVTTTSDGTVIASADALDSVSNGYTVTYNGKAHEDDFSASVTRSFSTLDPSFLWIKNYLFNRDDDDNGAFPWNALPENGASVITSAAAYGEDPETWTTGYTNARLDPVTSTRIYDAKGDAFADAQGQESWKKSFVKFFIRER